MAYFWFFMWIWTFIAFGKINKKADKINELRTTIIKYLDLKYQEPTATFDDTALAFKLLKEIDGQ